MHDLGLSTKIEEPRPRNIPTSYSKASNILNMAIAAGVKGSKTLEQCTQILDSSRSWLYILSKSLSQQLYVIYSHYTFILANSPSPEHAAFLPASCIQFDAVNGFLRMHCSAEF